MKRGVDESDKIYEPCFDLIKINDLISEVVKEEFKPQLVLFKDAIRHIFRICRILKMQRGHMVLVGIGGSGRRCLAKLAGILSSVKIMGIEVNKKYVLENFR
jgi:dynein heavy chain